MAAALVEGTILAGYRFDRYRARRPSDEPRASSRRSSSPPTTTSPTPCDRGAVGADAQNFARELQDTPANDLTPGALGRARPARSRGVEVEVHGREWMAEQGMGALPPSLRAPANRRRLITVSYTAEATGRASGWSARP